MATTEQSIKNGWTRATELAAKIMGDAERQVAVVEAAALLLDVAQRALEAFPELDANEPDVGIGPGTIQGVRFHVNHLHSFSEVVPLLRWLRQQGLPYKGHEDYAEINRRTYTFGDGSKPAETLRVLAFTKWEGSACRRVETGETRPVYKLVCADSPADWESEDAA